MVLALLMGVGPFVRVDGRSPKTSDYDAHGFGRPNEGMQKSTALAAISSRVSDSF